ncbi:MAG: N-acetylmuramoyl-L-alanine amidase [Terriglobales bacterium]
MKTQASTTLTRTGLTRGGRAFRFGVALFLALLPLVSASARVHHNVRYNDAWARQQFAKADRMREALNGRPLGERTRREYQRVIDSYRRVYFSAPASSKADPSVVATAELMVEMGRRFDDNKILRGAIDEYRFLRKQYPGSKYRFDALFTIGEIYKDDLNDPEEARTTFTDFVHRYPRNRLADDARAAVKEIDAAAEEMEHLPQKTARRQRPNSDNSADNNSGSSGASGDFPSADVGDSANAANVRRSGLPRVTGVRHWSTPDYTRVAIDVEQEVKFGSQRISNPDRIFFDLRGTKLASTLVGKTFDVDDGFLKKIRVAEFQPGRTRIVLEVDNLASYDAFLLPDPYRLIIDIHGKDVKGKEKRMTADAARTAVHSAPEMDAASSDADDDSSVVDAAGPRKGLVETDLPPEDASAESSPPTSGKAARGNGVTKTTVEVKDSNHGTTRRIPKTIVAADADSGDDAKDDAKDAAQAPVASRREPSSSSSSLSSPSASRRKKSRPAALASAPDTADLHTDASLETRETSREARPTAAGDRSLTRVLGLKIGKIVIDAGHGGHDTGTIGPNGLQEKDVVLDVAKRLGRLLESRLGAEVIYTRQDDTFIPLETRTAIANRERADLFISIHANSSHDTDARGVETYYLNFTSSPEALEVAARENAVSEKSIYELQDLVKKIALKEKIEESREFAGDVQQSLYGGLALNNAGIRNRGIKKAPFIVLIGANMPSILAEISFVSNPTDERKLETSEHRQRIAESLYRGVSKYVNGLSGVKVASKIDKPEGQ